MQVSVSIRRASLRHEFPPPRFRPPGSFRIEKGVERLWESTPTLLAMVVLLHPQCNGCVVASTMQWLCCCIHNATVLRNLRAALAFVRKQISNVGGLSCGEVARERTRTEQECVARGAMEWNRLSVWVLQLHQPRDVRRGVRQLPEHARDLLNLWHAAHLSHHHHLLSLPRGTPRPPPHPVSPSLAFRPQPSSSGGKRRTQLAQICPKRILLPLNLPLATHLEGALQAGTSCES